MSSVYCFSVHAEAVPAMLARVLDVLGLYGPVPSQVVSRRQGAEGCDLVVDAQLDGMSADAAAACARRLARVVGVTNVLFSEKRSMPGVERWAA